MTPARIAVATALTHTTISESSARPRAKTIPSQRHASFGRKPARISASQAAYSPRAHSLQRLAHAMDQVGRGAADEAAPHQVEPDCHHANSGPSTSPKASASRSTSMRALRKADIRNATGVRNNSAALISGGSFAAR